MPQQMVEETWLPETLKLHSCNGDWFLPLPCERFAQTLFQTTFPPAQRHVATNADKDVNVIRHQNVPSGGNVESKAATCVLAKRGMDRVVREERPTQQGVEGGEIQRRIVALKDNRQTRRLAFEFALHNGV